LSDSNQQRPFWTSLPGVLTGVAGVLGAITGLIALFHKDEGITDPQTRPKPAAEQPSVPPSGTASDTATDHGVIAGVRIIERRTVLDLSEWRQTSENDIAQEIRRSLVVSRNTFVLERLDPEQRTFVHRIGTSSSIDPIVHCTGCRIVPVAKKVAPMQHEWDVVFPIGDLDVGDSITISFSVDFWNAFQSRDQWWGGFRVLHDTERAMFTVVFPDWKKPASNTLKYGYKKASTGKDVSLIPRSEDVEQAADPNGRVSQLQWTVDHPQPDRSYRVYWQWE
jgi:hypothetical protein